MRYVLAFVLVAVAGCGGAPAVTATDILSAHCRACHSGASVAAAAFRVSEADSYRDEIRLVVDEMDNHPPLSLDDDERAILLRWLDVKGQE